MGRPSTYKPEYCDELIEYVLTTPWADFRCFAAKLGVSHDTLYQWVKKHPEFADAKKHANAIVYERLLDDGYENRKEKSYNTAMWIFRMKNQCGWRDKREIDIANRDDSTFKLAYTLDGK